MSKRKLLLADDSITIQKVVNLTFADEGIEVITVGDGDSAMEKINESLPDLILADVNMPGLSGYEICEQIKQNSETKSIPVILLVGSFEPFDEARAQRIGADDYLTKPFQSIRQLVNKVTELLEANAEVSEPEPEAASDWQFADTKEMPKEEINAAVYGDAGLDDEMIDTERFEIVSDDAPPPFDAVEVPQSFATEPEIVSEDTAEPEEIEESQPFAADENEARETDFGGVSGATDEDEPEKSEQNQPDRTNYSAESEPVYNNYNNAYSVEAETVEEDRQPIYEPAETEDDSAKSSLTEEDYNVSETRKTAETQTEEELPAETFEISEESGQTQETDEAASENDEIESAETEPESAESFEKSSAETENEAAVKTDEDLTAGENSDEREDFAASEVSENVEESAVSEESDETGSVSDEEPAVEQTTAESDESTFDSDEVHDLVGENVSEPVRTSEFPQPEVASALDVDDMNLLEIPPIKRGIFDIPIKPPETKAEISEAPATESPKVETSNNQTSPTEIKAEEKPSGVISLANLSPELIDAIAQKIADKISEKEIKDIVWEVVPQMTELIIKKISEEKEK